MSDSQQIASGQTRLVIQSMKARIATKILDRLALIAQVKYLSFDRIRLLVSDFKDHELPAIQLIDVGEQVVHEQVRAKKTWQISLELLMRSSDSLTIGQPDLWNLQYEVERKLWEFPNLQIPGVIQLTYRSSVTDLHLLEPFYFSRMDFEVSYYESLVRDC